MSAQGSPKKIVQDGLFLTAHLSDAQKTHLSSASKRSQQSLVVVHANIVDSPTTRQACQNLSVDFTTLNYKTLDQLSKETSEKQNLFQAWKDYEKCRRVNFANVMKERRRIKAKGEKSPDITNSKAEVVTSTTTASTSNMQLADDRSPPQINRVSPQTAQTGRITLNTSSNTASKLKLIQAAKDPKDLLEIEKMQLQSIIEEEHDYIREKLHIEMLKMNEKDEAEMVLIKAREDLDQKRKLKERMIWEEKQRVKQQRLFEQIDVQKQIDQKLAEQAEKVKLQQAAVEEERKRKEALDRQLQTQKVEIAKQSAVKTHERKRSILQQHETIIEMKRQSVMEKQVSKQVFLDTIQSERRAMSTLKQNELNQRVTTVVSKSELLQTVRKEEKQKVVEQKDQKIETIRQAHERDKTEFRNLKSSMKQQRISEVQRMAIETHQAQREIRVKKVEEKESKVEFVKEKLKLDQERHFQQRNEVKGLRSVEVEERLMQQESAIVEKKLVIVAKHSEKSDIALQRERIRDQIKNIKKQYQTERQTYLSQLRNTNSSEQRGRLMIKFTQQMNKKADSVLNSPNNSSLSRLNGQSFIFTTKADQQYFGTESKPDISQSPERQDSLGGI